MRWAGFLLALFATVSTIRTQDSPDDVLRSLAYPDGSLPELAPRRANTPVIQKPQTRADCSATCSSGLNFIESDPEWRLSRDVLPSNYKLHLDVDVEQFQYSGVIEITVKAAKDVEQITLHSNGLTIGQTEINHLFLNYFPRDWGNILSITEDPKLQTVTFHLSKALNKGYNYVLKIPFSGPIRKELFGFYRSSYKVRDQTRWLATTQFEPVHARTAFPCFDEPNMKATFDISITHDRKYSALSNMPVAKTETDRDTDRVTDTFKQTPAMSTYLVAFIVSDFKSYSNNEPISSIWANEDWIKNAKYSQEIGVQVVRAMEEFTKITFSLPKIDHVAIPDFNAGAMENWGLITYRDYLLIKNNETITPIKQFISGVIAHEVAHQWFGNLVTLDWWSYTWLNEGFATFFENYVTESVTKGKYAMWEQFIPANFQRAMGLDGTPSTSVPMTSKASTPNEIGNKFDQISYSKGGTILRMIQELLTIDKFRDGLQNYLSKKQYNNAKPSDLFEQWEKVSSGSLPQGVKFTDFAKSWTEQDGVPIVTAMRSYESGEIIFTQQRYYDVKPQCSCDYDRRWWIPLTWTSQNDTSNQNQFKPQAWLRGNVKDETLVQKTNIQPRHWLLVNPRSVGYYRVNYDTRNWLLLTSGLAANPLKIPSQNRAQILNDAFSLASSGNLDFAVALQTLNFLPKERVLSVWMSATRIISIMLDEAGSTDAYPILEEFWQKTLTDVYYTVGLTVNPTEDHQKSMLRYYIAPYACFFGVEQCLKDAEKNLQQNNPSSIHPDVLSPTFCGVVRAADRDAFWKIRDSLSTIEKVAIQQTIVSALGRCQPNNAIIKEHLEETLKPQSTFPQNLTTLAIHMVLVAPSKYGVGFDFITNNLDNLLDTLGKNTTTILVQMLIGRVRTDFYYQKLGPWLANNKNKLNNPDKLTQEYKNAESKTEWNMFYLSDVADWLAASVGREPPDTIPTPPTPTSQPPETTTKKSSAVFTTAAPLTIAVMYILKHVL